jgi:hypothetical protein
MNTGVAYLFCAKNGVLRLGHGNGAMKRREPLKQLTLAGTGLLSRAGQGAAFARQEEQRSQAATHQAKAIRGLVERNGEFLQPVQIPLSADYAAPAQGATAVIRIDGVVRDAQPIAQGTRMLEALTPAVERSSGATSRLTGRTARRRQRLKRR